MQNDQALIKKTILAHRGKNCQVSAQVYLLSTAIYLVYLLLFFCFIW